MLQVREPIERDARVLEPIEVLRYDGSAESSQRLRMSFRNRMILNHGPPAQEIALSL